MVNDDLTLIATTTMGLESLTKRELSDLGYHDIKVDNGRVAFKGTWRDIARANLWLRTADRVKIEMGQFKAASFEELFEKTKALPWDELLPENAEFPVTGKSVKSELFSVPDCQAIVKKAVVERMKNSYKTEWFKEDGPLFKIEAALLKDIATLTIDTTGPGLHRRGYRYYHGRAPLKETLASAMILLTNWRGQTSFIDPFCGSGTIPIEAAMIAQNIAPGFNREFVAEGWPQFSGEWDAVRIEADDVADYDRKLDIIGTDIDHQMVELSEDNAREVGLAEAISFKQMQVKDLNPALNGGYLIGNPPYGERLEDRETVEDMYRSLGRLWHENPTWSYYIITSHPGFEKLFGEKANKKRKLYNGNIKTHYYQYFGRKHRT